MYLFKRYKLKDYKFSLVALVTLISILGVLVVGSANQSLQGRQAFGVVVGLIIMVIVSLIDYQWVLNLYWILYIVNILLLVAVLLFGVEVNGAQRWLNLGFTRFQPSDLTKIITILFYAKFLMDREHKINQKKTIIQAIALMVPTLILIYKEPNLSNTICLALLFCIIMYLGGLSYRFIGTVLAIILPVAIIFLSIVVQPNQKLLRGYQQDRILAWLEPEKYATETAYQQLNSVMAIGSGQLTGKGLNNNTTTSVKNGNFLSEPETDFIFAIIGEELGFVGCCIVILLLLLIVIECILIGQKAKDTGGRLICGGVAALIGTQSFINVSVATMIFPNTGISLPFISYGLTSVVCFFIGIGLVLNVGLQPNKYQ
ncbi:FtsW/RodA/SpoVE family cell cycle protein [Mediterraneibacter butyricigenes]|uniref:FtsW/RodA/SpoVE family cell cycle protein n=1 Tax=Mediterraneibacter butyricigenes TaxID=2316025 RepID=UPI000E44EDE1|nr:FtsW/RodA/SpoVE family cell cycle protein [Mediterraneibacter butyricigenes]RGO28528.1 rod shape-determining protein RodA [Dorea sp. OM02-2LB]RGV97788.1 rod shape-determining protein RodA [Ruminococcus sp. AF14-10]